MPTWSTNHDEPACHAEGRGEVKERSILFTPRMAELVHRGLKTQTRRVVKPQPYTINGAGDHALCLGPNGECVPPTATSVDHRLACPYGGPCDNLFVRESVCNADDYNDDGSVRWWYRGAFDDKTAKEAFTDQGQKWRPSIHMPRAACRTIIEIVSVKVERHRDISEADAIAEGFASIGEFVRYFNDINAVGMDVSLWCFALTFRRVGP